MSEDASDDDDDAVLARLFVEELSAQLAALGEGAPPEATRRALHKLKGSAGLVGHRALGETFARLERRVVAGDEAALREAEAVTRSTLAALREGRPVPLATWPAPPDDLRSSALDPTLSEGYRGAMLDRLARLDAALATTTPEDGALAAYREIHSIKGAALAVGDEVVAWFTHGLEERLLGTHAHRGDAERALREVARHRAVLAEMIIEPDVALAALRVDADVVRTSLRPRGELPLPPRRPPTARAPADSRGPKVGDATVRVGADTLQEVFDRLARLGQVPGPLGAGVADLRESAEVARSIQRALLEARRRIGPPRPWGPPAAAVDAIEQGGDRLAELASRLERVADRIRSARARVSSDATAAQTNIATMRTTSALDLFERIQAAALADARRVGRPLEVEIEGAETLLDRELAEALVDPLLQLARNAIAHGLEAPGERVARGKPAAGLLRLRAEATSGSLTLAVEDDGAGVDVAEVRRKAVERGTLTPEHAGLLDDVRLLAFLFRPGFSTRDDADLLAGRGLGLGVVLRATHRLGGTLRLRTRRGFGLSATISLPSGASLLDVLWVRAGSVTVAIPSAHVLAVEPPDPRAACLAHLLGLAPSMAPRATLRIGARPHAEADAAVVSVDDVGSRDEVHLRAIEPIVRATGPWAAAVAWGDEIRMSLDPQAVIDLANAARANP